MASKDSETRINRLLNSSHIGIRRAYLNAVGNAKNSVAISEIEESLLSGDIERLVSLIESIPQSLSIQINLEFSNVGTNTSNLIASVASTPVVFDSVSNRAVAIMQSERLRLIREFSQDQRDLVRSIMADGVARQINPIEQARNFRNSIGLTSSQEKAVRNYRRLLENRSSEALNRALRDGRFDRSVLRAIQNDEPLPASKINRMVQRYRERYLKYRAEVIGRTEALRVVNVANEESIQQAVDNGILDQNEIERRWVTVGDERVRGSHAPMTNQKRKFGELFETGLGNLLKHPGDPNAPAIETIQCRCLLLTEFN